MQPSDLLVVTSISNPVRFASRWALWEKFQHRMRQAGVDLLTVELTYGEHHPVCRHGYGDHLHLRTAGHNVLWHKENLLNIGARSQPHAKFLAFVDADVSWTSDDWAERTLDALQIFPVVQMFENAHDLGPTGKTIAEARGFVHSWTTGATPETSRYDSRNWHPGYAWAMTRHAYDSLGGLIDYAILGSADRHMCMSLVGLAGNSMPAGVSPHYRSSTLGWQANALARINRHVGYVPQTLLHHWHGRKADRGYQDRWKVLVGRKYDPAADILRNPGKHGLIEWSHETSRRSRGLRDDVYRYMTSRNEDSVDVV